MGSGTPSYDNGAVDTPLLYMTIGECLQRMAARQPEREALVSVHQDRRFTYGRFDRLTDRLAKGLLRLGVKKGDRVGIWAVNRWEWVAMQFATPKIGAVLVNINPAYRTHELRYALEQSGTETLVLMHSFKTSLEDMKAFCKGKIAHLKVPKYWKFVASAEAFPMTVTGKTQKFKMREAAIEELGLEEASKIETA